jgi:hypothetical protein
MIVNLFCLFTLVGSALAKASGDSPLKSSANEATTTPGDEKPAFSGFNNTLMIECVSGLANGLIRGSSGLYDPVTKEGLHKTMIHINKHLAQDLEETANAMRRRANNLCSLFKTELVVDPRASKCAHPRRPKNLVRAAHFINQECEKTHQVVSLMHQASSILREKGDHNSAYGFLKGAEKCALGLQIYEQLCTATGLRWEEGECVAPERASIGSLRIKKVISDDGEVQVVQDSIQIGHGGFSMDLDFELKN